MMNKQQKRSTLNELIKTSQFEAASECLKEAFNTYLRMRKLNDSRYEIQLEFYDIKRQMKQVENSLQHLILKSERWEKQ